MYWFETLQARQALERDQNPIVGDPDRIAALAAQLHGTAAQVRSTNDRLRGITVDQFWRGLAAERFVSAKQALPPLLDLVVERYSAVGAALTSYHPQLREAQSLAARALADYRRATQNLQAADAQLRARALFEARYFAAHSQLQWVGAAPAKVQADATAQVEAAIRLMATAIDNRDRAARATALRIQQAAQDRLGDAQWLRNLSPATGTPTTLGSPGQLAAATGWLALLALALSWLASQVIPTVATSVAALLAAGSRTATTTARTTAVPSQAAIAAALGVGTTATGSAGAGAVATAQPAAAATLSCPTVVVRITRMVVAAPAR